MAKPASPCVEAHDLQQPPWTTLTECLRRISPPETGVPAGGEPWWRQWFGPGVAATIISALVIALVTVGVAGFNSLKGDIRDLKLDNMASETRLREDMKDFRAEVKEDFTDLRAEIKGDMKDFRTEVKGDFADLKAEIKGDFVDFRADLRADLADLRADNRALNDKLDRVLEVFLAGKS